MSTTLILNNLFNKKKLNEEFDLNEKEIFGKDNFKNFIERHDSDRPVTPKKPTWKNINLGKHRALVKSYKFDSYDHMVYFINEILSESKRINHDPRMIIQNPGVEIILYTHDFNDVTEIDLKLSQIIDEIYEDIFFIG